MHGLVTQFCTGTIIQCMDMSLSFVLVLLYNVWTSHSVLYWYYYTMYGLVTQVCTGTIIQCMD